MSRRRKQIQSRYRIEDGTVCIDIHLRNPLQLFDTRDPAPFLERDLDDDAVDYIVSSAEEFSYRTPVKVVLRFSEPGDSRLSAGEIRSAIHAHFSYQAELLRKKAVRMLKTGRFFAIVGALFLAGCLFLAELAGEIHDVRLGRILREGLIISGWVALWRPVQLFLYDWIPLFEKRRNFSKLSQCEVEVRTPGTSIGSA